MSQSTAANLHTGLSAAAEDYLRAILRLSERAAPVTIGALAARLSVTAPSATQMVKRLAQLGLVTHEPYRGVALTGAGRDAAEHIAHRNRLVIEYLVNVLGYAECDAPGEADQIEHALSERLTARIAARLGSA